MEFLSVCHETLSLIHFETAEKRRGIQISVSLLAFPALRTSQAQ